MIAEPVSTLSDDELVTRTVQGDPHAYGRLYDRYQDSLYRYIYFRVADHQEAEDLTELTFLKAWEMLGQDRSRIVNFQAWLYRTAHNLVIDHYRAHRQVVPLDQAQRLSDLLPLPESILLSRQDQDRLQRAFAELDPDARQILTCRFIHGFSHEETARRLGLNETQLRVRQFRALKKLRKIFNREHD